MTDFTTQNKSGWVKVAFGDVVKLVRERSNNPELDGFNRVVGLEHLDPGELNIIRWADIADGTTFTNIFRPGQVLFGKRRAYQRKVALASFEGVCSGDIYVLESSSPQLMPELLPFICQSDTFFDHAVGTSAGSLSPRTNWASLANFEFMLPPLQEQARIVELLNVCHRNSEKLRAAKEATQALKASLRLELSEHLSDSYKLVPLERVSEVNYGLTVNKLRRHSGKSNPYLRVANVGRERLMLDDISQIGILEGDEKYQLQTGDVLVVEGHANKREIGRACLWKGEISDALHQNHLIRIRPNNHIDSYFVCSLINSPRGQFYFQSHSTSSSGLNTINSSVVKAFSIPAPSIKVQQEYVDKLTKLDSTESALESRYNSARTLLASLLNRCLLK